MDFDDTQTGMSQNEVYVTLKGKKGTSFWDIPLYESIYTSVLYTGT